MTGVALVTYYVLFYGPGLCWLAIVGVVGTAIGKYAMRLRTKDWKEDSCH